MVTDVHFFGTQVSFNRKILVINTEVIFKYGTTVNKNINDNSIINDINKGMRC